MSLLTDQQVRALRARAGLLREPFTGRADRGVRDAQLALAELLRTHAQDREAMTKAVHTYLYRGPAWDSQDYYDGGQTVHADVEAILAGDTGLAHETLDRRGAQAQGLPTTPKRKVTNAMDKPLLLIDVDGPLNPFDAREIPSGYQLHLLQPQGFESLRVWLNPGHGQMLLALADRFELTWATTWGEHDQANTMIAPLVGLPPLPTIEVGRHPFRMPWGRIWKRDPVEQYVGQRPFAWFDDQFERGDFEWAAKRTAEGSPTLLLSIDPRLGLLPVDIDAVARWWERIGESNE